jgi:hypothetical protein
MSQRPLSDVSAKSLRFIGQNAPDLEQQYQKESSKKFFGTPSGAFLFVMTTASVVGTCVMLDWLHAGGHDFSTYGSIYKSTHGLHWIVITNLLLLSLHRADFCRRRLCLAYPTVRAAATFLQHMFRWQVLVLACSVLCVNLFYTWVFYSRIENELVEYQQPFLNEHCDQICNDLAEILPPHKFSSWPRFCKDYPDLLHVSSFKSCRNSTSPSCSTLGPSDFDKSTSLVTMIFTQQKLYAGTGK